MAFAKAGTIRILAVTGSRRSAFLPEVPTMVEAGYNVVVESWLGVFVPAKTPADIVGALSAAIGEAVKSSQMIENLAKVGNTTAFQSPQEFAATVKADIARWAPVVKASGFVAED
jgi:tripartite-type tricarboxylate transporter receptor subunit TctC